MPAVVVIGTPTPTVMATERALHTVSAQGVQRVLPILQPTTVIATITTRQQIPPRAVISLQIVVTARTITTVMAQRKKKSQRLEDASGTSDGIVSVTKILLAGLALHQAVALALTG
jgi:hypothetical protein